MFQKQKHRHTNESPPKTKFYAKQAETAIIAINEEARKSVDKGLDSLVKKKFEQAEDFFSKAIRIQPDYANAYACRGMTRILLERTQEAVNDFDEAVRIDPLDAYFRFHRAKIRHFVQDDQDGALADLEVVMRSKDSILLADAYALRAKIHLKLGNIVLAEVDAQLARENGFKNDVF